MVPHLYCLCTAPTVHHNSSHPPNPSPHHHAYLVVSQPSLNPKCSDTHVSNLQPRHSPIKLGITLLKHDVVRLAVVVSRPLHAGRPHDGERHFGALEHALGAPFLLQNAAKKVEDGSGPSEFSGAEGCDQDKVLDA